jgi:hypothetical protein
VRLNTSSTQVYMALKPGEQIDESTGDLLFSSTAREFRTDLLLSRDITSRTFSFYYPRMRPHNPPRYAIVSSTNARYEDWADLPDEQYEASKRDLIETTLDALEKYVPNCRERIAHVEAATPGHFGTIPSIWRAPVSAPSSKDWRSAGRYLTKLAACITPAALGSSCPAGWAPSITE